MRHGRANFGLRTHPPRLGEGGRAFLKAAGLEGEEIERLREAGVMHTD